MGQEYQAGVSEALTWKLFQGWASLGKTLLEERMHVNTLREEELCMVEEPERGAYSVKVILGKNCVK